ncbi:restriction endonuclease subunit S [Avibacterium avium]|uniref:restriction endonuclease subunit S n=1 Tax=Avibacterium avium TaxID=751 RepID=UPI003BF92683
MKNLKSYEEFSIGGGWGKEAEAQGLEKVAIIRGTDFEKIISSNFSTVPIRYETTRKISSRQLCEGDLIIEVSGGSASSKQRTGRCLYVTQEIITKLGGKVIPASFCKLLRLKKDEINPKFIYYQINNMHLTDEISLFEVQSTGICNFQFNLFLDEVFPALTDLKKQNKVVNILENLDKKITLNTQTNQTLEQIAQTIFKHWFIDFAPVHAKANALARGETIEQAELAAMACLRGKTVEKITALKTQDPTAYHQLQQTAAAFPSEFGETEMGEVPKGWEYRKAEDLFDIGIGKTPPRKESKWFSDYEKNNIEWISIKDMGNSGSYILNSSEYLIPEAISQFNIKKIPEDTVLLSFKLTIGRISITTKETTTNEAIAHFKTGKSYLTTEFLYCYLKDFDFDKLGSTSSIATAVNSRTIKNMDILCPSEEIQMQFIQKVKNVFRKIKSNTLENEYLTKYRDELLPKLLSGEIEL